MIKYSICITNFNAKSSLQSCLDSVLSQIDSEFEIVVSDNCSTDGSLEILKEYAKKDQIKLIVQSSTRGKGRQIAFQNSIGDYILSGIDTDDVINPILKDVLRLYHLEHEGYMLSFRTFHIIPRYLVNTIGGWKDLQWGEDVDFIKRVEELKRVHYFPDASHIIKKGQIKRGPFHRLRENYAFYQCRYRIGADVIEAAPSPWYLRPLQFFVAFSALTTVKLKRQHKFEYEKDICS